MVAALTLVAVAKALRDSVSLAAALALLGEPLLAFRIWARDSSTARVVQVGVGHGEQEHVFVSVCFPGSRPCH